MVICTDVKDFEYNGEKIVTKGQLVYCGNTILECESTEDAKDTKKFILYNYENQETECFLDNIVSIQ